MKKSLKAVKYARFIKSAACFYEIHLVKR